MEKTYLVHSGEYFPYKGIVLDEFGGNKFYTATLTVGRDSAGKDWAVATVAWNHEPNKPFTVFGHSMVIEGPQFGKTEIHHEDHEWKIPSEKDRPFPYDPSGFERLQQLMLECARKLDEVRSPDFSDAMSWLERAIREYERK
jgi:hypothetical protein